MATVFTHALLPVLAGRGFVTPGLSPRRFAVAAALCACVPDLDLIGYAFDLRPPDVWAHRGFTHSLLFAVLFAAVITVAFFPSVVRARRSFLGAWLGLSCWGASHGILDALTRGEVGVAFFAPFSSARFLFPFHPVPVIPLGADEAFGRWGALVFFNELLLLIVPIVLVARGLGLLRGAEARAVKRLAATAIGWLAIVIALQLKLPEHFAPSPERVLRSFGNKGSEEDPGWIPRDGLPDERLVTRFDELKSLGLFDVDLEPRARPWSSTFFPSWYGGASGRWKDGRLTLIGRTLNGFAPMPAEAGERLLNDASAGKPGAADQLLRLAATEKYDLVSGDPGFESTRLGLMATHNRSPLPRFWFGLCNGIAAASLAHPEPFRTVDVINPNGHRVRFLPNDVKALLGSTYVWMDTTELGGVCERVSLDSGRDCSINPGGLVLAVLNRIGLAHTSFLVDVHPSVQAQYYAVARARVNLKGGPTAYDGRATTERLKGKVASLLEVEVKFDASSTTLSYELGDRPTADQTRYEKVGLHAVPFTWTAILALDSSGEIIGGQWTGEPPDGPDHVSFLTGGPLLTDAGVLQINPAIRPELVAAIARASVDEQSAAPLIDLRLDGGNP